MTKMATSPIYGKNLQKSFPTELIVYVIMKLCMEQYVLKLYKVYINVLSPIGRIQILTYLIWGILGAAIFDCVIRSCDLFDWFIQTCFGPTFIPAVITSLELFCVLTMSYFPDNVSSKENIKILWLIFMFYCSDISRGHDRGYINVYAIFTFDSRFDRTYGPCSKQVLISCRKMSGKPILIQASYQ